jgi:hypothetical protein
MMEPIIHSRRILLTLPFCAIVLALLIAAIPLRIHFVGEQQRRLISAVAAEGGEAGYTVSRVISDFPVFDFIGNKRREWFPKIGWATFVVDESTVHLPELPDLSRLRLKGAKITDKATMGLARCAELDDLSIERTSITDSGISELRRLPKLYRLTLDAPALSDRMIAALSRIAPPGGIAIKTCHVTDDTLVRLGQIPLTRLYVEDSKITDIGLAALEKQSRLFALRLSRCTINDEGLKHIGKLTSLFDLDISGNNVTDRGLKSLDSIQYLVHFLCHDTKITSKGLAEFQTRHPQAVSGWPRE